MSAIIDFARGRIAKEGRRLRCLTILLDEPDAGPTSHADGGAESGARRSLLKAALASVVGPLVPASAVAENNVSAARVRLQRPASSSRLRHVAEGCPRCGGTEFKLAWVAPSAYRCAYCGISLVHAEFTRRDAWYP